MKVLLVNGSPHKEGATYRALREVENALKLDGIETKIFWIGNQPLAGCIGCGACIKTGRCFREDTVNEALDMVEEYDGFVFGSAVHYAAATGALSSFMDRLFYGKGKYFWNKPAAAVVSCRRGGAQGGFEDLNRYFTIACMPIVTSNYWNEVHGNTPEEVRKDEEGMQTMRTLMGMGHFDEQAIIPDIQPVSDELVNINWPLQEKASDQFNIAGGWGSGTFVGSIGVTLNNLSMRNFFKKGAWRPYPSGQNQRLSISGQTNGTYYKALSLSFTDPWLGGRRPNSFTISGYISEQNNAYYVWQDASMYYRSMGLAIGLGKRLQWPDPYFTFYGELGYQRYGLKGWNSFIMSEGNSNTLSLKLVLQRSSVDAPFFSRSGSEFTLSVQATPPFSLWDGKNYADPNLSDQDRYRWIEFHKWLLKGRWYFPLTQNQNLVLMLGAEMGFLGHYNKNKVSPFERFEIGGDGMTGYNIYGVDIISLRGYEDGALDPSNYYSVAYNKYTVELRYPIIMKPNSSIYVLGFLEGGNGFNSWKEFSPFKIKRSAGVGVRLYLPIVGMLGIDWGYGFDPAYGKTKRSGSQFHFVMGQQF